MADLALIDGYLGELRHVLRRSPEADDIVAEVADHLIEGVVRRREQGLALPVAERSVLTEFGDPLLVGRAFASAQHGGIAVPTTFTRRAGMFGLFSAVLYVSGTVMMIFSEWRDGGGEWGIVSRSFFLTGALMFVAAGFMLTAFVVGLNRRYGGALGTRGRVAAYVFAAAGVTSFAAWVWGVWLTLLAAGAVLLISALRDGSLAHGPAWAGPATIAGSVVAAGSMWIVWLLPVNQDPNDRPTVWLTVAGLALFAAGVFGISNWMRSELAVDEPDNMLAV